MQTRRLSSDMSAFKAVNPGASLEAFRTWHATCSHQADEQPFEKVKDPLLVLIVSSFSMRIAKAVYWL